MKTESQRLFKNSVAVFGTGAFTIVASAVFVPVLTRYLGRDGYGVYSEIYAFVQLFAILSHFGTDAILTREAAQAKKNTASLLGQTVLLRLIMSGAFLVILAVATVFHPFSTEATFLLALCALETVTRSIANTMIAVFRALEVMQYELVVTLIDRVIWVIGMVIVVAADLGLAAVFAVFLIAALVRLLAAFGLGLHRLTTLYLRFDLGAWRDIVSEAWPIGITQGSRRAFERVGTVQLASQAASGAVGLFSGANRIFQLTYILTASVATALYPAMSAAGERKERLQRLTSIGFRTLLLTTLPIAAFYLVFAPWFTPLLLGSEYQKSALALQILAPATVAAAVNALLSSFLRASGRQRYDLLCALIALAANLGLNALLIPPLGYLGPAVAILVSQVIQIVVAFIGIPSLARLVSTRNVIVPLLATGAMIGVWWVARLLPVIPRLVIGAAVYIAILALLGGIERDTLYLIGNAMGWRAAPDYTEGKTGSS